MLDITFINLVDDTKVWILECCYFIIKLNLFMRLLELSWD